MGRISMFCGVENYVLRYKPVYYKVITDYVERIQYSVFSFFRCTVTSQYGSLFLNSRAPLGNWKSIRWTRRNA